MDNSRKFRLCLISLGALLAVYLLYSRISKTPRIEIDREPENFITDSNVTNADGKVGMIGDVGVGKVQVAEFITRNKKTKEVENIFGFEKLLHQTRNEWDIEKPYMNIFRRDLGCYITADRGRTTIETVAGRPSPKDAKFTGNVVVHILPETSSDVKESFIYLDDITFISDKSHFSTPGPVKYVSQDAQMLGTGLELIYNDGLERLEFLKIAHLESMHLKSTQAASFSTATVETGRPADANSQMQTEQPDKPVAIDEPPKVEISPDANTHAPGQKEGEHYRCVFNKNVFIDSPEQLIFAQEQLTINNIFRPKTSGAQSDKADPNGAEQVKKTTAENADNVQKELEPNPADSVSSVGKAVWGPNDIIVTCDDGFVVTPMEANKPNTGSVPSNIGRPVGAAAERLKKLKEEGDRTILVAYKIDYCAATSDTVATGPSELTFYTGDPMTAEANDIIVPVTITARKQAKFLPALNQAVFEGDSVCTMRREDANSQHTYTLSAPVLTVDLPADKAQQPSSSVADIKHLTTGGGKAKLLILKTAKEKLLGGIELKCTRIDYNDTEQVFLAAGPGEIVVDNSKISEPNADAGRFSLSRQCYARVQNFDTLKYFFETNRIIAESETGRVVVDYFPVGVKYGQYATAQASRIEAFLYETPTGQTELSTLHATGGVTYEEEDIEFEGSELFYDAKKSKVDVQGDELQPCYFNGALVDAIEYDLKTGKVKANIVGPGALQMKR